MKRGYDSGVGSSPSKRIRLSNSGTVSRGRYVPGSLPRAVARYAIERAVRAHPYGRAAMVAYRGYKLVKGLLNKKKSNSSGRRYVTTGKYVGKFKKKRVRKTKADVYLNNGFKNTTEISGTVSDPDCVYVGHSTTSGSRLLTLFNQVTLRKLFQKAANLTITNVRDPIKGYVSSADGWRLILTVENRGDGSITESVYDTVVTDSIYRICGSTADGVAPAWPDLYNFWVNYAGAATASVAGSTQMPTRLSLYLRDFTGANYQFMGDIYYPDENVNLYVKSELKVQNRTLSASGGADSEDVSNNPLVGRLYQFNSGAPRSRVEGVRLLETIFDYSGVSTHRAAEFTQLAVSDSQIMKEPPEARIFNDIVKTAKIRLEPGHIKQDNLVYKRKVQVHKFWQSLDWRYSAAASTGLQMKSAGKCTLIALEDVINVNVAQNISIAYEVNRAEMMYLSTSKYRPAQGLFRSMVQSSNPA